MKPSVSKLIGLLDKPALLNWANRIGLQGVSLKEYRKQSSSRGTNLHEQIELYVKEHKPFDDEDMEIRFLHYFSNKKILEIEKKIETEYFVGRMDLLMEYNGKKYLCDFKSNHKTIYFENILQLTAYRMSEGTENVGIISIPEFKFLPVLIKDFTPYEVILKSLHTIYITKESLGLNN